MAGKVGEAFVEIVADYAEFAREAEKRLNVLLRRLAAKADFGPLSEASGDAGEDSAEEFTERFEREVNSSGARTRRRRAGERAGRDFSRAVGDGAERDSRQGGGIFGRLFGDGGRDRSILGGLLGGIGAAFKGIFGVMAGVGSAIGSVVGTLASLSSGILTTIAVAALLAPVIFVLTGALISLSGVLIPLTAGFAGLLAIVPIMMIAFSGFGEALSAVAEGDIEKFNEALKGLSPSARLVAKEFQGLWPILQRIKGSVQEAFFEPLVGSLTELGNNLLPRITPGLESVANALGRMAATFLEKLNSPAGIKFFETALNSIATIIEQSGPGLERFFTGLANAFIAALPFAEKLFKAITDGLGDFGEFLDTKVADGSFEQFLEDALATGEEFVLVIKELIGLFAALFEDTDEGGRNFLKDIRTAIGKLTDFFKSKDGKAALDAMIKLAGLFGSAMIWVASQVGRVYRGLRDLKNMAESAKRAIGRLIETAVWWKNQGLDIPGVPFFADGGVVTRPTLGVIGEAGPEVVVPLNNPGRARELMQETGLVDLAAGMGGDGETQVIVYLGTEQITDILDKRIVKGFQQQGRRLAQGVREG